MSTWIEVVDVYQSEHLINIDMVESITHRHGNSLIILNMASQEVFNLPKSYYQTFKQTLHFANLKETVDAKNKQ